MSDDLVVSERTDGAVTLRLNRSAVRNALNLAMIEDLRARLAEIKADDEISVVVMGSTDPAAFSAGMDTTEVQAGNLETDDRLYDLQWDLESFPKPIVGALSGYVLGGGAELAMSFDIRVGAPTVTMSFPATGYGLVQGSWHLIDAIGWGRAKELVLTGRRVEADEALQLGLLHEIHPDPDQRSAEIAAALAERSPGALKTVKEMFLEAGGRSIEERFEIEHTFNMQALRGPEVLGRMRQGRAPKNTAASRDSKESST